MVNLVTLTLTCLWSNYYQKVPQFLKNIWDGILMNPFFLTFHWIEIDPHPDGEIVEFSDARTTYAPTPMITEGEALTPTFPNGCSSNHSNLWLRQSQCLQPQLFNSDLSDQKRHQYETKRIVHLAILDQKDHQFVYLHWTLKHSSSDKIFPLAAPRAYGW